MKQLIDDIQQRIKESEEIEVLYPEMDQLFKEVDLEEYSEEIYRL
jgi:hypothetical protein